MIKKNYTFWQFLLTIFVFFAFIAIIGPIVQRPLHGRYYKRTRDVNNLKNICIAMRDYAASDTKFSRMPYPITKGSADPLPKWGESKECWSPGIIKLLFKTHSLARGNENILISGQGTLKDYKPMRLTEDLTAGGNEKKMRWGKDAELFFHVYCEPGLTDTVRGDMILGISYDQPMITDCLFKGKGWLIFKMDGSMRWVERRYLNQFDLKSNEGQSLDVMAKSNGLNSLKLINSKASLRNVFGLNGNGGSTELIGRSINSAQTKIFLIDVENIPFHKKTKLMIRRILVYFIMHGYLIFAFVVFIVKAPIKKSKYLISAFIITGYLASVAMLLFGRGNFELAITHYVGLHLFMYYFMCFDEEREGKENKFPFIFLTFLWFLTYIIFSSVLSEIILIFFNFEATLTY